MPKRNNPFGDQSPLQLKTHVGTKQLDQGVCQQSRMQAVWDKTTKMLMEAPNKPQLAAAASPIAPFFPSLTPENLPASDETGKLRQMYLSKNCQLVESTDVAMEESDCSASNNNNYMDTASFTATCKTTLPPPFCSNFPMAKSGFDFGRVSELSPLSPAGDAPLSGVSSAPAPAPPRPLNAFEKMQQAAAHMKSVKMAANMSARGACVVCQQPVTRLQVMKCQFCEAYACGGCTRQCCHCLQHFCRNCSTVRYNKSEERAFCLTCTSR